VTLVVLLAVLACARRPVLVRDTRLRMGTMLTVTVWGHDSLALERAVGQAFDSVRMLDSLLSTYQEHSEITTINGQGGSGEGSASVAFAAVLGEALAVARASNGAFDPTLGDWRGVHFDRARRTVRLEPGLTLDFGGIAKGYALDRAALPLAGEADSGVLDFGGQLLIVRRSAGPAVRRAVGIVDPADRERVIAIIEVDSGSVSTSSQAERPGHIVDPRTGAPATRARSVTVVAPSGIAADAWSTGFFVLGCDSALALAPALRVHVVCLDRSVRWSAGLDGRVALPTDSAAGSAAPSHARAPGRAWAARRSTRRSRGPDS
jgi:FAD:protein FMN transferase